MILDRIENSHIYYTLHGRFKNAFEHIRQMDINNILAGRYEVDADKMYVLVQEFNTKLAEAGFWEAHRRYIDLQYVVKGSERFGHANITQLKQGQYDPNKDFLPLEGVGDFFTLRTGFFVLLFPEDAHMPSMAVDNIPAPAKKIVVKIAVE